MRRLAALMSLLPALTVSLGADTYPRQPGVDAVHYVFRLMLDDVSDRLTGESTVTVRFLQEGLRDVWLDLASARDGKGMSVSSVTAAGAAVPFTHTDDRLRITLPVPSREGEDLSMTITYAGVPADGLRTLANIHGERTVFSQNFPDKARHWLPTIDHPADKATGELIVTAPAHYQVVANGVLVEERDLPGGTRLTHWRQSVPISSWLYALGVARFAVHHAGSVEGVPLQTWVFPQDREIGRTTFEEVSLSAMSFFTERIGPYPYEKLAHVQAAGMGGGMEHASAIFYGEKNVASGRAPVVHEIAHQWFGNAVTERDWDDVWLSEGFATYFTLLHTEHAEGRDAFVAGLKRTRDIMPRIEQRTPGTPIVHRNLADMGRVLNQLVYEKAAWVLHMLRGEVGTETFWTAVRTYYRRYRNQVTSTAELRGVFEQASGRPLDWFFAQWLTRPGIPKIEGTWRYDAGGKAVEVTLSQAQPADTYRLTVEVGIVATPGGLPRVERMALTGRQATMRFPAETAPVNVVLDPGTWLLMEPGAFGQAR